MDIPCWVELLDLYFFCFDLCYFRPYSFSNVVFLVLLFTPAIKACLLMFAFSRAVASSWDAVVYVRISFFGNFPIRCFLVFKCISNFSFYRWLFLRKEASLISKFFSDKQRWMEDDIHPPGDALFLEQSLRWPFLPPPSSCLMLIEMHPAIRFGLKDLQAGVCGAFS